MRLLPLRNLSFAVLCSLSASGLATSVTLNATADVRIINLFDTSVFDPDILSVFNDGSNIQRTLIQFDLSGVPVGDEISSATLRLFGAPFGGGLPTTTSLFRTTNSWIESQTSWANRGAGTAWSTAGGDFVGTTGSVGVDPYATYTGVQTTDWMEFDVTQLAKEWHAGTHQNYGMMLTGPVGNFMTFTSREGSGSSFVPELVVNYAPPVPEPGSLLAVSAGLAVLARRRRRA